MTHLNYLLISDSPWDSPLHRFVIEAEFMNVSKKSYLYCPDILVFENDLKKYSDNRKQRRNEKQQKLAIQKFIWRKKRESQ